MELTLIAEGSTGWQYFIRYWGVSFVIGDVLFDTFGRADIFWKNIKRYGIDISNINKIVISHDDWDHIDGLKSFIAKRSDVPVYVCGNSSADLKEMIQKNGNPLLEVGQPVEISKGIFSLGQMKAETSHGVLYEQSLAVRSDKGLSIITGCAHPGIVNIVKAAKKELKEQPYLVAGGFHLKENLPDEIMGIAGELAKLGIRQIAPLHCSGVNTQNIFMSIYGDGFIPLTEGGKLEL